jgi:hypothetical protein
VNGYTETLFANLVIPTYNLWIIGAPPQLGAMPKIDINGFGIIVTGYQVFIWGLNITDSVGSPIGIQLAPSSMSCTIMNNTITGLMYNNTIGIQVMNSSHFVALNTMSWWGTCIQLAGPSSNNAVVGNTLNPPYSVGIEVTGGAAFNKIYWNNLMAPTELLDTNPPMSPPNWFDDTTGGGFPGLRKGNYEVTWGVPTPPFTVPGPNLYRDNWPLVAPWTLMRGDINVDGRISLADLVLLANGYGQVWCNLLWDPRCDLVAAWGVINIFDLVVLARNYGQVDP